MIIQFCQILNDSDTLYFFAEQKNMKVSNLRKEIETTISNNLYHITSDEIFLLIAKSCKSDVAANACMKIEKDSYLKDILYNSNCYSAKVAAISNIKDISTIEEFAINNDGKICIEALKRIDNNYPLKQIVYDKKKNNEQENLL